MYTHTYAYIYLRIRTTVKNIPKELFKYKFAILLIRPLLLHHHLGFSSSPFLSLLKNGNKFVVSMRDFINLNEAF